jgi:3-phenylpropionate/trans-cinnamate dioxygenase ferredoxin reductase subunit
MTGPTVVIVGCGQAGLQAAASLREQRYEGRVVLVGDEPHPPYQRPPLSKGYLLGEIGPEQLAFRPEAFFSKHQIELVTGKRAVAIDRNRRAVTLEDDTRLSYDHLVLATGTRSRPLAIPGVDLRNVFYLRTLGEATDLRARLACAKHAVVIGAGFIGLEFAASAVKAVKQGLQVTVLEQGARPMPRAVSGTMASVFAREHERMGVRLRFETRALRLLGKDGCVAAVETADGQVLDADLVLIGIGALPNSELAADSGITTHDGVIVDEQLRTSDPHISAIGDVAAHLNRYAPPTGQHGPRIRLESVQNATDQARCVALRLTGQPAAYTALPWFWSHQGSLKLQMAGLPSNGCEEVVRGDASAASCAVFLFREGSLVCVETLNRPGDHMLARRLLAHGCSLTPEQAADVGFDLKSVALKC